MAALAPALPGLEPPPRLTLVTPASPPKLALIEALPEGMRVYDDLAALAARLAQLLQGRDFTVSHVTGCYPPYGGFPALTVCASPDGIVRGDWLACAHLGGGADDAARKADLAHLERAIRAAKAKGN